MKMNPQTASTLVWAAAAATIVGFMVMSPGGQFISYVVAILLALVPTLFGSRVSRVAGGVILVISLLLAFQVYPVFKKEGERYRKRGGDLSGKLPTPADFLLSVQLKITSRSEKTVAIVRMQERFNLDILAGARGVDEAVFADIEADVGDDAFFAGGKEDKITKA